MPTNLPALVAAYKTCFHLCSERNMIETYEPRSNTYLICMLIAPQLYKSITLRQLEKEDGHLQFWEVFTL